MPQGGRLGIVGPSGSGKTSLFAVLLRFWEHQEGEVSIGGVPTRTLRGETVRGLCSVVAQQTHLFNTSIRENLLLARPDAADAELLDALRRPTSRTMSPRCRTGSRPWSARTAPASRAARRGAWRSRAPS